MREFKPPHLTIFKEDKFKIFLAGTIDMGNSIDWQHEVSEFFSDREEIDIYNPRRDKWESTWKQDSSNKEFLRQVNWELNAMDNADLIIFNFLPNSKSPVTMLELGLHAISGKIKVCCPQDFYRHGNIEIVCQRYNIELFENLENLLKTI